MKVSIITPTVGKPHLKQCIESVRAQTYKNIEHIVVVDGEERWAEAEPVLLEVGFPRGKQNNEYVHVLPYATGKDRFLGHRIYGAMTFVADGDYHMWLDDDNTFEPNHVESLVTLATEKKLDWAFSFRKIVDLNGNYVCHDDCESLGMWPSILDERDFLIDVNCYLVKKHVALGVSPHWYRKYREPNQIDADRAISAILTAKQNELKYDCTREYTVNYRVGNTGISVQADFFIEGNKHMMNKHKGELPWKKR